MFSEEILQIILHGREERNIEYKGLIGWNDNNTKAMLTKTILAMSNIRDGGAIVIGIEEDKNGFNLTGLPDDLYNSYRQDDISAFVNEYADPYVELTVTKDKHENLNFVVIQVKEFMDIPVICKKDGLQGLRRGAIYTRPRRKIETTEIPGQVEMREVLDIAIDKIIQSFKAKIFRAGIEERSPENRAKKKFTDQLSDL